MLIESFSIGRPLRVSKRFGLGVLVEDDAWAIGVISLLAFGVVGVLTFGVVGVLALGVVGVLAFGVVGVLAFGVAFALAFGEESCFKGNRILRMPFNLLTRQRVR